MWFDDNKHVLGTVGMCILIVQVRGPSSLAQPSPKARGREDRRGPCPSPPGLRPRGLCRHRRRPPWVSCPHSTPVPTARDVYPVTELNGGESSGISCEQGLQAASAGSAPSRGIRATWQVA